MADFVIYKMDVSPTGNRRTDTEDGGETIDKSWLMNYIRKSLHAKATWTVPNAKGDPRLVSVVCNRENVAVLAVHNSQKHEIYKPNDATPLEMLSQPHCDVVLDMRGEDLLMAVERSSFFRSETDIVMKMVLYYVEKLLDVIGKVNVHCMYHIGNFWEVVHYRTDTLKDTVRSLTFHFDKDANQSKASDRVRALMSFNTAEGGGAGSFTREAASKDEGMILRREDYNELVDLCEKNKEYTLSVKFRDCGAYRVGRAAKYFWRMPNGLIQDFVTRQTAMSAQGNNKWELVNWFETLMAMDGDYQFRQIYTGKGDATQKAKIQVA